MGKIALTAYGAVEGIGTSVPGVSLFKGVPIGADTGGANRFMPPKKPVCWNGVRKCDTYGDRFVQSPDGNPPGSFYYNEFYYDDAHRVDISENGLVVNIYAPDEGEDLPVYVYFHGGAMVWGYASEREFCAERLAARGVIVVLAQYRLGFMGMFTHADCANISIRDAVFDLEWVRDNIAAFGGSPKKVTIGGQSAGAGMVHKLLCCEKASGLFRAAVVHSGFTGLVPFIPGDTCFQSEELCQKWKQVVADAFGREMGIDELRRLDWRTLMEDGGKLWFSLSPYELPQVALDGEYHTRSSIDIANGPLDGINILIGGTSDEFTSLQEIAASRVRELSEQTMRGYVDSIKALNVSGNVYAYFFAHVPPGRNEEFYGAFHSSELWYAFNSLDEEPGQRDWRKTDRDMANLFSGYLASFIKTGDPNTPNLPVWQQCNEQTGYTVCMLKDAAAVPTTRFSK